MKIIVIGHGMVGHKFLEQPRTRRGVAQARGHGAVRRAAPGLRPRASVRILRRQDGGRPVAGRARLLRAQRLHAAAGREGRRHRPRRAAPSPPPTAKCCTTTSWCSPPAPRRSCRRCRAATAPTASSTAPSKTWRRCRSAARARRPAWWSAAACWASNARRRCATWACETHVVEFAPRLMAVQVDDGGGRVLRSKIEALGVHGAHAAATRWRSSTARRRAHRMEFADGTHLETDMIVFSAGIRPRDELRAPARAGARRARRHRDRRRTAAPATATSTRSANARCGTARSSAWSRRATTWRAWRRSTSPARTTPTSPAPT